ncbi:MAG: hypothetical protein LBP23_08925 [Treponema sp.]|jgi:hypothetical protein|nr:hypothetical protein [Treponema sp.]
MKLVHIEEIAKRKKKRVLWYGITACVLPHKGTVMKQFEYLTHSPDFIREVQKDGRGSQLNMTN